MATHYEEGTYECKIIDQALILSLKKKTPGVEIQVMPTGRINPNNPDEIYSCDSKYPRKATLWFKEGNIEKAQENIDRLRSWGWTGTSFDELHPGANTSFSLAGVTIVLECTHNADGYENWEFPYLRGNSNLESDINVGTTLDNMFGKALQATVPASQASSPAAASQAANESTTPPSTETTAPAAEPVAAAGDGTEDAGCIPF